MQGAPLPDAVKAAWEKRPDILQQGEDLKARDINVRATNNALLPPFTVSGQYLTQGLGGNAGLLSGTTVVGIVACGLSSAPSNVFNNRFPDYTLQLKFSLPFRNRPP